MNLNKHFEFFNPTEIKDEICIIGCGAIGSTIAEMLVRLGIESINLYDFDTVSEHNITNQMFRNEDIGKSKVDALEEILLGINPDLDVNKYPKGWDENTRLSGYVFLAVDSIEIRKAIVKQHRYNKYIKFMSDCRMRLTDAQSYAADWNNEKDYNKFWKSMDFTSEEAKDSTPVSACGTTLSVTPTVRIIVSFCCSNFINFVQGKPYKNLIMIDAFSFNIICFPDEL